MLLAGCKFVNDIRACVRTRTTRRHNNRIVITHASSSSSSAEAAVRLPESAVSRDIWRHAMWRDGRCASSTFNLLGVIIVDDVVGRSVVLGKHSLIQLALLPRPSLSNRLASRPQIAICVRVSEKCKTRKSSLEVAPTTSTQRTWQTTS